MSGQRATTAFILAFAFLPGCLARQIGRDGRNFRQALLDMYTDQVLDNIVRAAENRPFAQISYRNCIVTDQQTRIANLSDEYDPTQTNTIARATSGLLTSVEGFTNKLLFGASLERDRTMQFKADPVVGSSDVFDYYRAFASDPDLLRRSPTEPLHDVHIKAWSNGIWYWVPTRAAGVFQQLGLKTTFMRGPPLGPPIAWPTIVACIQPYYDEHGWPHQPMYDAKGKALVPPRPDDQDVLQWPPQYGDYQYVVTLSQTVPNATGKMTLGGANCSLTIDITLPFKVAPYIPGVWNQPTVATKIGDKEPVGYLYAQTRAPLAYDQIHLMRASFYADGFANLGRYSPDAERLEAAVAAYRCRVKPLQDFRDRY